VLGRLFLESGRIRPTLLGEREIFPRTGTAHRKCMCGIRRLTWEAYVLFVSGFPLHGVQRFESP
jgi:hypothetical protein